ncbi:hypothetical protein ACTFIY_007128 [Dictyostelium cf. discoideum]
MGFSSSFECSKVCCKVANRAYWRVSLSDKKALLIYKYINYGIEIYFGNDINLKVIDQLKAAQLSIKKTLNSFNIQSNEYKILTSFSNFSHLISNIQTLVNISDIFSGLKSSSDGLNNYFCSLNAGIPISKALDKIFSSPIPYYIGSIHSITHKDLHENNVVIDFSNISDKVIFVDSILTITYILLKKSPTVTQRLFFKTLHLVPDNFYYNYIKETSNTPIHNSQTLNLTLLSFNKLYNFPECWHFDELKEYIKNYQLILNIGEKDYCRQIQLNFKSYDSLLEILV